MSETTEATVTQPRAKGASKGTPSTKKSTPKKGAAKARKAAKKRPAAQPKAEKPAAAREGSKKAIVLDLLRRPEGASLTEIMSVTGWMAHSVRGFISGGLAKKMGLTVESTKNNAGERTYKTAK